MAATLAFAEPPDADPSAANPVKVLVEKVLLKPLSVRERQHSRLSRVMQPAAERRVRVRDAFPQKDSEGKEFVTFAVDVRYGWDFGEGAGGEWQNNDLTGCSYLDSGEVFIKRGEGHYPAAMLLGKRTKVAAKQICVGQPAEVAAAK